MAFSSESLRHPKLSPITVSREMAERFLPGSSLKKECSFRQKPGVKKSDLNPCLSLLFGYFFFKLCKLQGALMQMVFTCYSLYLRTVRLKNPVLPGIQLRTRDGKNKEILSGWYFPYLNATFHTRTQAIRLFISNRSQ